MTAIWKSLIVAIGTLLSAGAFAQSYPTKPVRMIIPISPASGTIVGRLMRGDCQHCGATRIVENRPGTGGRWAHDVSRNAERIYLLVRSVAHAASAGRNYPTLYGTSSPLHSSAKSLSAFTGIKNVSERLQCESERDSSISPRLA
jgi:hypothetical protein